MSKMSAKTRYEAFTEWHAWENSLRVQPSCFESHMQTYFANRKVSAYPMSLSVNKWATSLISKS